MNNLLVKVLVAGLLGGALVAAQVTIAVDPGCSNTKPDLCGTLPTGALNCVDRGTDENNCGTCGLVCGGSQVCVQGKCVCPNNWPNNCVYTSLTSSSTITACHNFTRSEVACGRCYNSCSSSTECILGQCTCSSPTTTPCVDGAATYCVKNTTTSYEHCGGCFNTCPTGQSCSGGKCTCPSSKPISCPWGAGSICVNTLTSENHCGVCWNRCGSNEKCIEGKCTKSCPRDASTLCTVPNLATVVTVCANTDSDAYHCGGCFNVCPRAQRCRGGKCVCSDGKTEVKVGPNKDVIRCVDTRTSSTACGASRTVCPSNLSCRDGQCKCPRDRPNECPTKEGKTLCFNFRTDKSACGGCFNQCPASQKCRDSKCVD